MFRARFFQDGSGSGPTHRNVETQTEVEVFAGPVFAKKKNQKKQYYQ